MALEWSQSCSAKPKPRVGNGARCSHCPSLPPSPAAPRTTPPLQPEDCGATGVSHDSFASATLDVAQGPASVAGQREQKTGASLRDFGPKLLFFFPHPAYRWHWPLGEQKFRVFTGKPSFLQGWLLCCQFIFLPQIQQKIIQKKWTHFLKRQSQQQVRHNRLKDI